MAGLRETDPTNQEAFNPANGLSLKEGELIALVYNPDLRIARLKAEVAVAKAPYAGLWQDPVFNLSLLKITESIPDPWFINSSLPLTLPISGRLQAEKRLAEAEVESESLQVAESEWQIIHNLRKTWLSWSFIQRKIRVTEDTLNELENLVKATQLLTQSGEIPRTESSLFVIERDSRRAELDLLLATLAEEEQILRSLLGLSPVAALDFQPAYSLDSNVAAKERLSDRNLTLARLRQDYQVAENVYLREIRKQYPDLALGPQAERDNGQSRIGLIAGMPIPILNANKSGIAEARALRDLSQAAFETEFERLTSHVAALEARLQGIEKRGYTLEKTLAPAIDQQVSDAHRLLELGESSALVLLESLTRSYEMKLNLLDARRDAAITVNTIRFLVGPPNENPREPSNLPLP